MTRLGHRPTAPLDAVFLVAATALGGWLRLRELAVPSFWFDEVYHYKMASEAAKQAWWRWLTIFEIENGPLFYAGQLLGRIAHSPEFSARIAPALCGIATIPMIWLAARAINTYRAIPYAAALLIAISPLDVYYSREARPYALVVLITTALILALLRGAPMLSAALLVVSFYSGAMMAPVIASVVAAAAMTAKRRVLVTGMTLACVLLLALCYRPGRYPTQMDVPGVSGSELRGVLESFSIVAVDVSRPHRSAYVFVAFAAIGAIALLRRNRNAAIVVIAVAALPVAIGLTATGFLHRPFGVRYVIGGLPGYLLLVAAGVAAIATLLSRWRFELAAGIIIGALLAREGWDAALTEPFQKLDWRAVARAISLHARDGDTVIAADPWTREQIGFYLPPRLSLVDAGRSRTIGEIFAYQHTTSWLVVGDASSEFAQWACRFPVLLGSPLQQFRLHYVPSDYYFLTDRSTRPEHRALLGSFGGAPSYSFSPGDDPFLGDGWSGAERDGDHFARWAVGRQAFIAVPAARDGDEAFTLDILPASPGRQMVTVNLNNATIAALALDPQRKRYTFRGAFRNGINILRFDFDHTVAPADVDPRSSDRRPLAARFFGVGTADSHLVRLDEGDSYLDETSVWRARGGRDLPPDVDRSKLAQFAGRLGLDPDRAIPALMSGRVTVANLATTIADDSACADDQQFLRMLFPGLLGREISERELADFSRELQHGVTRSDMAWRLGNSDEVRKQVQR